MRGPMGTIYISSSRGTVVHESRFVWSRPRISHMWSWVFGKAFPSPAELYFPSNRTCTAWLPRFLNNVSVFCGKV